MMEPLLLVTAHTRTSQKSSSLTTILNIFLTIVVCVFIFSSYRFVHHSREKLSNDLTTTPTPRSSISHAHGLSPKLYYDYEHYPLNESLTKAENKSRRCFYIDLGCFDGRDVDFFIHFHLQEISRYGRLTVIAFEPDPINFSACKSAAERHKHVDNVVRQEAVWNETRNVPFATEKGQRSKIDFQSVLQVPAIDFSQWLLKEFRQDDFVYVKFSVDGAEIPILEKMVFDGSLALVDYLEIEWNDALSPDLEPRRVSLECMFDNFGMDFLYMINPVDLRHALNGKESFYSVPIDKGW